jgi:hypothetical protein
MVEYLVGLTEAKDGSYWNVDDTVLDKISEHTIGLYEEYELVPYIHDLFNDGLL